MGVSVTRGGVGVLCDLDVTVGWMWDCCINGVGNCSFREFFFAF